MALISRYYPGNAANDSTIGTIAWSNPSLASAEGDGEASAGITASNRIAQYLKATNFGFTIPTGSTINGIIATVKVRSAHNSRIKDYSVKIVKSDGTIGATNKAVATTINTTQISLAYGSVSDLWDESWTAEDINDIDFGFVFASQFYPGTGSSTSYVESMNIQISYDLAYPVDGKDSDILIVAGGGGGGSITSFGGGGGGGGGINNLSAVGLVPGSYSVVVGNGATAGAASTKGNQGEDSFFMGIQSVGGGGGGGQNLGGQIGGSGGGGAGSSNSAVIGGGGPITTQGYSGAVGNTSTPYRGGGGGGAGAVGVAGITSGDGGAGLNSSISGSAVYYGGGGGGGTETGTAGAGGNGGGGAGGSGAVGTNGTANTGGGGGGTGNNGGGTAGGSGIVIVRYLTSDFSGVTGGTITTDGAYTIHTFTSNGTFEIPEQSSSNASFLLLCI